MKNSTLRLICAGILSLTFTGAFAQRQGRQQRQQQQQQQQQGTQNDRSTQMAATVVQTIVDALAAQSDPLKLIFRKDVQHDLGLELGPRNKLDHLHDRQVGEIQQLRIQQRQNRGRGENTLPQLEEAQRKETQAKIDELLTKDQKKRLDQIAVQLQGPAALLASDVQKQLEITEEQRLRISQIRVDRDQKIKELQEGIAQRTIRIQDLQLRLDQIQKESAAALKEMLTEDQQEKLQKLFGKPFKVGG
jgi:hypothetical protein